MWYIISIAIISFFLRSKEIIIGNEEFLVACIFLVVLYFGLHSLEDTFNQLFTSAGTTFLHKLGSKDQDFHKWANAEHNTVISYVHSTLIIRHLTKSILVDSENQPKNFAIVTEKASTSARNNLSELIRVNHIIVEKYVQALLIEELL